MRRSVPIATEIPIRGRRAALTTLSVMVQWGILILRAGVLRQSTALWRRLLLEQLPDSSTVRPVTGRLRAAALRGLHVNPATALSRPIRQPGCRAMPLSTRTTDPGNAPVCAQCHRKTLVLPGALTTRSATVRWGILIRPTGLLRQSTALWPRLLLDQLPDSSTVRPVTGRTSAVALRGLHVNPVTA